MRIQHNIMAMNAYRNYTNNTSALSKNLEKLSSGYKINRAGDDAAGLAISEKMRAQITGDVYKRQAFKQAITDAGFTLGSKGNAGGTGKALTLQIGDTSASYNQLNVSINDCHTAALEIDKLDIGNQKGAAAALDVIKNAINYVSDVRGTLGATQNRLDHTINNLSVMQENIQDAESTIRDTDVADEMMAYTKNNILIQSAQAMLAQANQVPQGVLQLLQ